MSSFCDFWGKKRPFAISPHKQTFVFQMFLLRSINAYLYPYMIHFDGVDFSERHSEEW